jgi:diguanylate cyclase
VRGADPAGGNPRAIDLPTAPVPQTPPDRARGLRFARRIHRMRTLGLALGALCVAAVLQLHDAHWWWWAALILHGFVWPHVATALARASDDPRRTEKRQLMAESALGGMWIAVMQFNLLPSVLVMTMLSVDKVDLGNSSVLARSTALMAATCALTSAALGFPVQVQTPMPVMLACIPLLVVYPLTISGAVLGLARRVTDQNRRLEELGRTDVLTGLANRRQGFAAAKEELARHARSGRPAALVILDIDHFKEVNDLHGHPVGDEVLCGIAAVLRECTRTIDTAARHGGDEFLIVMPETGLPGAEEVARRIRQRLAALSFAGAPGVRCTISLGAVEADRRMPDVDAWVREADSALYRAKASGRDRFVGAPPRRHTPA